MKIMSNFDVYIILIDGGRPCDILYVEIFEKLRMKKEYLSPYEK